MSLQPNYEPLLAHIPILEAWHQAVPYPKDRPRMSTKGGRPRLYTPSETVKAERSMSATLTDAWAGRAPLDVGVAVELVFVIPPPRRNQRPPDIDNLAKLVLDAGNGVLYTDDRKVAGICATRRVRPLAEAGTLILMALA